MEKKRRYALLLCAEESDYVKKVQGGYLQVFVRLLGDKDERWDLFRAVRGELPRGDDEIGMYDGFVISGSCNDAHGDDLWIRDLIRLLKRLDSLEKKVLGICFGHQILCRALGGKTGRAKKGWDIGFTTIHLSSSTKYLPSPNSPISLSVIKCHRDEVLEIPPKAEVVAWSEETGVEMFRLGDHIMGIQGHPEYTKEILLHLIDRLLQFNLIQSYHAEIGKARIEAREPDREIWKKLCKDFLKG
ncbi:putative glutamine amidotransferase [Dioscorea sansibarensis]